MNVVPQLIGYPRIAPHRELKWALERRWSARSTQDTFDGEVRDLRQAHLDEQRGLIGSAIDDYFLYDEVLESALMLGLAPEELVPTLSMDPFEVLHRPTTA
jgi:5-methyltetrahydropteroyltriglutamate--homocysteine methyltransferase